MYHSSQPLFHSRRARVPAYTLVRATPLLPSRDLFALQSLIVRARNARSSTTNPLASHYQALLPLAVGTLARYHWPLAWRVASEVAVAFGGTDLYDDLMAIVRGWLIGSTTNNPNNHHHHHHVGHDSTA